MQSPRTRSGGNRSPEDRRRWQILIGTAALGFLGLAVVIALVAFRGGSGGAREALENAGCTLQTFPATASGQHVEQAPPRSRYNSFPPTSGPHNPTAAPFDVYDEPVEQYRLVHNMEHGGVAIQYGRGVPEAQVSELVAWYREHPNGLVVAPLPELGKTIALAAWNAETLQQGGQESSDGQGILAKCPRFRAGAFDAFVDAYAFKGPERIPEDALAPGS